MKCTGLLLTTLLVGACTAPEPVESDVDCSGADARTPCSEPVFDAAYYAEQSSAYFDTMDYTVEAGWPPYSEHVARWEWPPWLMLTAFGREDIEASDTLLTLYPSIVVDRDCRGFDTQPFGRCRVTFYYDAHDGLGCPIYEEFSFNDDGEITWIEAWSDQPGMLPMGDDDPWAEGDDVTRLSTRIPGLGTADGAIALDSEAMQEAAAADADVADFVARAEDWTTAWRQELADTDTDTMWSVGCGWQVVP